MSENTHAPQSNDTTTDAAAEAPELVGESLVEEVSIDGMCGVY